MKSATMADDLGTHERESTSSTIARRRAPERLTLRDQQGWFADIVTTPASEPAGVDNAGAARLVTPSATLSALERLEIYRRSYHARLIECLADDYPVLKHALGVAIFEDLCRAYIAAHPSREWSLNAFGRHMPAFASSYLLPNAGFLSDLAALEWAIVECIHAPTAPILGLGALERVPAERWPEVRLAKNPSLRILRLRHAVNAYLQAYRSGQTAPTAVESESAVAVYRTGTSVWRMELLPPSVVLLESLARGEPLGGALDRIAPLIVDQGEAQALELVSSWFQQSVLSGLFSELILE